ncbi:MULTISPECIES: AraC family transcriptional regulator [Vibrio]|uniref:AraC family transcriptional regulator n=1 Tax=Vibrio aestuarianus TaxID=28171 RepID=A0ABD7YS59_9VIBR|nr:MULTISPECIES: AraC family transcriptional regulator [Vibrio]MCG3726941.1 AraC family transcriptional regulator [Vibrio cincinnatiensis]PNH93653.1 AraC family transcriptional regulator [Vibrio diazotrophicus]TKF82293.1 AraC family transcriptional regulator [Vibrio kanaloae]WGK87624.1 AraC family transcriptional regulator [Vibrio aestuarianus]CAH8209453.1 AraC-type transcriptional regulator domain protein [Vibrio aestuarianus]
MTAQHESKAENRQLDMNISNMQSKLAKIIEQKTVGNEDSSTSIESLSLFRREVITEPCACAIEPSVLFVVQGSKQLLVGEQIFIYDTQHFLLNSLDMPASSQVVDASLDKPCLGLMLKIDMQLMADIIAQNDMNPPHDDSGNGSSAIGTVKENLLVPLIRLLDLLDEPEAIKTLSPLIVREIHYRLLTSELAGRIWQIALSGNQANRISKAIGWLRVHYSEPLNIEELASYIQMSTTTLYHHFRKHTSMSPLQYQKWLRLNEAQRLMLNENSEASSAAFQVGYESPSHFSREYTRLFGISPKRHIEVLRKGANQ